MRITVALFTCPLLTKELVERAARASYVLASRRCLRSLTSYFFFWSAQSLSFAAAVIVPSSCLASGGVI
jgi:hypothetical protein